MPTATKPSRQAYLDLLRDMERNLDAAIIAWARDACRALTFEQAERLIGTVRNIAGCAARDAFDTGRNAEATDAAASDAAKTA